MVHYLPEFLDGLFNMLSDGNREIRQASDTTLCDFLREIEQNRIVVEDSGLIQPLVDILVGQCGAKEKLKRLTAVTWIHKFIELSQDLLVPVYSDLLGGLMNCISDTEVEIRQMAELANDDLLALVNKTGEHLELSSLLKRLTLELINPHVPTRVVALRWISMLLETVPERMHSADYIDDLLPALKRALSDQSDDVVLLDLEVLARICLEKRKFHRVLGDIVKLFASDRKLLEDRGSVILRKLCVLLNAKRVYMALAEIVLEESDTEFAALFIQTLNLILLTARELQELRSLLKSSCMASATAEEREVFTVLFKCWSHNPVATFSLCLLAQVYELSALLVSNFGDVHITVGFLMQIDKLVQLLESPIFVHLRLQLLESNIPAHSALLKSLYGLLMLLPQSAAFKTLRDRLASVAEFSQGTGAAFNVSGQALGSSQQLGVASVRHLTPSQRQELLDEYLAVQKRHMQALSDEQKSKELQVQRK